MTDLQWASVTPKKCRHNWATSVEHDLSSHGPFAECTPSCKPETRCLHCGNSKDFRASRRGRNNRSRGNAIERWVCKQLGITRVGMFGSAEDGGRHDEPWSVQVKSGGYFTERYWTELKRLPANAQQTALLVVADTPGPGHQRRAYVVMDLDDFRALHVGSGEDAA